MALVAGSAEEFDLSHRFLNASSFFTTLNCILGVYINGQLGLGPVLVYIGVIFSILFGFVYCLGRIRHVRKFLIWPFTYLVLFYLSIQWFFNSGSQGGMQYFFFAAASATIIILPRRKRWIGFASYLVAVIVLVFSEYSNPALVSGYPTEFVRFIHVVISFSIALSMNLLLLAIVSWNQKTAVHLARRERRKREETLKKENQLITKSREQVLQRNSRMERELRLARAVQDSFSPTVPPQSEYTRFAFFYESTDTIGGDLFGFSEYNDGTIAAYIADVAGHGLSAAFLGGLVKMHLDGHLNLETSPSEVLATLNEYIISIHPDLFVTAVVSYFYPDGKVIYSNGGHPYPIVMKRKTGNVEKLQINETLLGVYSGSVWKDHELKLESGDKMLFYTDGVIEPLNSENEPFGFARLYSAWREATVAKGRLALESVLGSVREFTGASHMDDDITLISAERL